MSNRRIICLLMGLLFGSPFTAFATILNISNENPSYFYPWQATQMGLQFKSRFEEAGLVLDDPIAESFIENLGRRLVRHSPAPQDRVHFFIVTNPDLNAFTGPDGYIGINTGLICYVKNEGELAAAMAHETGHVVQEHLGRMTEIQKHLGPPTVAAAAGSLALGILNPVAGAIALASSVGGYQQHIMDHTRADEAEADRIGMGILARSGFDPMAMPQLFETLQQNDMLYPTTPDILMNHPNDGNRIADTLNRALLFPKKHYAPNPEFYLIQARIKVESTHDLLDLAGEFKQQLQSNTGYVRDAGLYGYALAEMDLEHFDLAQPTLSVLEKVQPNNYLFALAEADLETDEHHFQASFASLQRLYDAHQKNYPIAYDYALAAYTTRHYASAVSVFEDLAISHPENNAIDFYLAKAEADSGDKQDGLITQAKLLMNLGDAPAAKILLQKALITKGPNPYAHLQIRAMMS